MAVKIVDKHLVNDHVQHPKKITGTKFASILGLNPYTTPFATWCDITKSYDFPFEETIYTNAGKIIEPKQAEYIRKWFNVITPTDVFGEDYFRKTYGNFFDNDIFGGMWDYLGCDEKGETCIVFEMKTTGVSKRKSWEKDIPEYYALQAALYAWLLRIDQVYMVCSFLEKSDYEHPELYTPDESNTIIVSFRLSERYPTFLINYINPSLDWWEKYVVSGISPDYDIKKDKELIDDITIKLAMEKSMEHKQDFTQATMQISPNDTHTELQSIMQNVTLDVDYFNQVSDNVIKSYTSDLDDVMNRIRQDVIQTMNPELDILEHYLLELTNTLYFMSEKIEQLGIFDDVSKASAKQVYNEAYLNNQNTSIAGKKPTVAENQAQAEGVALYHNTVNSIYSRSYKVFRNKIESAYEMIRSISKIISKRMQEQQQLRENNSFRG